VPEVERERAFADRQAEIDEIASELRQKARRAWKQPSSFALGLAGAAWSYSTGNKIGALLSVGALVAKGLQREQDTGGAFSYIFAAHQQYG
jgi:hypothetical protein